MRFALILAIIFAGQASALDREALLKELTDYSLAGFDKRLGPDYAHYHKGAVEEFPEIWMTPSKQEPGGRRYQIGGPWRKDAGDYSSTQGQILYVPDNGPGVDRVTIIEWSNYCFSQRPEAPWWGGFRPEPTWKKWEAAAPAGNPGVPIAAARGMASWANCGVILFSSNLVGTAGTVTARGADPTFQFPKSKILTAVSVTNKNEFALITMHDTERNIGQVAVLALQGGGSKTKFAHDWKDDHPCLPNVALLMNMKLLGYIDLPENLRFPTAITAVGNSYGGRVNGRDGNAGLLREYDLAKPADRDVFLKGSNKDYVSTAGFAVVISKYEGHVAFLDLQPLFAKVRQMYFTTEENYQKTRDQGPEPKQWPYTFDADPSWQPVFTSMTGFERPTATIASMTGGKKARAFVACEDGTIHVLSVGKLATDEPGANGVERTAVVNVGRNPTCLAYQKYWTDKIIAVSRGDREIAWIQYGEKDAKVTRKLRDKRLLDPVFVEQSDTHGIETNLITVADFKGRQIINYRTSRLVWATQGGQKFDMGPDGKADFECGGLLEFPGAPFSISATNVN